MYAQSGSFRFLGTPPIESNQSSTTVELTRITAFVVCHSPMPPFPSHRFDLVEDIGGGGFSICEAVGARDWRIE
jgi:hypothetical protein